jgi:acyl-CoA synthetase (AMP-forming)/AMP-acid ligase II
VAGARLVCSNAPRAADVLDVLERERPTMVNGFAQSVAHLPRDASFARRDLSSIRRGNLYPLLPVAVRPADPELRHAMLGMTETGSVCLLSDDESDQPEHRRGSFGRPAPGFEVRVVDSELQLRGPLLMEGYCGRERHEVFDADGWYHTGDVVAVDDDGFFYFQGRRGDMIKTSGANVSPREVEAVIHDLTGLVAHVIGVADEARGQVVAAAVRVPADRALDVDALRDQIAVRLSTYKVPRRFLLLRDEAVPVLPSGKLDRIALEALFDVR